MLEFILIISVGNGWLRFRRERKKAGEFSGALLNGIGIGMATLSLGMFGALTGAVCLIAAPVYIEGGFKFTSNLPAAELELYADYFLMCRNVSLLVGTATMVGLGKDLIGGERRVEAFVNLIYRFLYFYGLVFGLCCLALM